MPRIVAIRSAGRFGSLQACEIILGTRLGGFMRRSKIR